MRSGCLAPADLGRGASPDRDYRLDFTAMRILIGPFVMLVTATLFAVRAPAQLVSGPNVGSEEERRLAAFGLLATTDSMAGSLAPRSVTAGAGMRTGWLSRYPHQADHGTAWHGRGMTSSVVARAGIGFGRWLFSHRENHGCRRWW